MARGRKVLNLLLAVAILNEFAVPAADGYREPGVELLPVISGLVGALKPGSVTEDVKFLVYNDQRAIHQPSIYTEIMLGNESSIWSSGYDPSLHAKVLVHGFGGAYFTAFPLNVRNAYYATLPKVPRNLIVVDWTPLSTGLYHKAVANAAKVGERIGEFLCWMHNVGAMRLSELHMVGLSLAGGVMGVAGEYVKHCCGQLIHRITGLDPARPGYEPPYEGVRRIYPEDANYVDIIHTNTELLGFGITECWGHADFFLNGGVRQPECSVLNATCSHIASAFHLAETIVNMEQTPRCACATAEEFKRNPDCCDIQVIFGEHSDPTTRGTFYLKDLISKDTRSDTKRLAHSAR